MVIKGIDQDRVSKFNRAKTLLSLKNRPGQLESLI